MWTQEQKDVAKVLAVSYDAYLSAPRERLNSRAVWADILKDAQEHIGVEMISPDLLERDIAMAKAAA